MHTFQDLVRKRYCKVNLTTKPWRVPWYAAAAKLAWDLVLQGPLAQVHHIRSLIDPHHSVRRASSQHQTHVFRSKLHVCHRGSTIHECGSFDLKKRRHQQPGLETPIKRIRQASFHSAAVPTNPVAQSSLLVVGLADNLLPDGGCSVKRAGGQNLTKFWMSPGYSPHRSAVCLHSTKQTISQNNINSTVFKRDWI